MNLIFQKILLDCIHIHSEIISAGLELNCPFGPLKPQIQKLAERGPTIKGKRYLESSEESDEQIPHFLLGFRVCSAPPTPFYLLIVAAFLRLCYLLNAPRAPSRSLIGRQPPLPAGGGRGSDAATARSGSQQRLSAGV